MNREFEIVNKLGLHARAAAKLVNEASRFGAEITVRREGRSANAKSIMSVMMLAASRGTNIVIRATGHDEDVAAASLEELVQNRFGEKE